MAATYATLRSRLLGILNRTDCTTARADEFFDAAYTRINREVSGPVMDTETVLEYAGPSTDTLPIPTKIIYELWVNGFPYVSGPDRLTLTPEIPVMAPEAVEHPSYRRVGRTTRVSPDIQNGDVIRLLHRPIFRRPGDAQADTLVTDEEDLLLYCALSEAAIYFEHDSLSIWEGRYSAARDALNDERLDQQTLGGPQFIQPMCPDY